MSTIVRHSAYVCIGYFATIHGLNKGELLPDISLASMVTQSQLLTICM